MFRVLLVSFGSVFLVVLLANLGMELVPRLFGRKKSDRESQNKALESDE